MSKRELSHEVSVRRVGVYGWSIASKEGDVAQLSVFVVTPLASTHTSWRPSLSHAPTFWTGVGGVAEGRGRGPRAKGPPPARHTHRTGTGWSRSQITPLPSRGHGRATPRHTAPCSQLAPARTARVLISPGLRPGFLYRADGSPWAFGVTANMKQFALKFMLLLTGNVLVEFVFVQRHICILIDTFSADMRVMGARFPPHLMCWVPHLGPWCTRVRRRGSRALDWWIPVRGTGWTVVAGCWPLAAGRRSELRQRSAATGHRTGPTTFETLH